MARNSPTHFLKLSGISLIEMLLALAIFAAILMISINRYQQYRDQTETATVKSDLHIIARALNQYFYKISCDNAGIFPQDKRNPSIADLGLTNSYQYRLPLITAYQGEIIDSGDKTSEHKPLYLLKINAILNSNLSTEQINWYGKLLNAGQVITTQNELVWQALPNNSSTDTLSPYWILNSANAVFRKIQNGLITSPHNYCAQ